MTDPSQSAEGQPTSESGGQAETEPPPDYSWIKFDVGLRHQDPATIEHKAIRRED
jgi:hypothetical protein